MVDLYEEFRRCGSVVSTDSRKLQPGAVFFALRGASFDGNRFALEVLDRGASFAVIDDKVCYASATQAQRQRLFLVSDVLTALQELAARHRRELKIPILAITGSNGKTTTKELIAAVLSQRMRTDFTQGNLNNHIGVPLTLLSMNDTTEFGIVEMGASARGEIARLCGIAQPDYGLITNVGRAHLEGFGGTDGVRKGKGELFDYLAAAGGRAFVRRDDKTLYDMACERKLQAEWYDVHAGDGVLSALEGDYNRFNIAAAVTIGRFFNIPEEAIREAIGSYVPFNNRSQRIDAGSNRLIVDCYNANPSSMEVAIDNFFRTKSIEKGSEMLHRMLILGDMLELGNWSAEEHRRVIDRALDGHPERLILVGPHFAEALADKNSFVRTLRPDAVDGELALRRTCSFLDPGGVVSEIVSYADTETACMALEKKLPQGCLVLIKGSRGMGLERIAELFCRRKTVEPTDG